MDKNDDKDTLFKLDMLTYAFTGPVPEVGEKTDMDLMLKVNTIAHERLAFRQGYLAALSEMIKEFKQLNKEGNIPEELLKELAGRLTDALLE
jgi:hypothetical protein